ncbi:AraC family transcriptional regulator [Velocimicrobium porci]|uniref:AraC family transcriptional regulator n=1 Tax=Velocimicrobium porci TaxID=2606634 RepID=A0A6L5XU75_9FIRM|nr:helix-turn-helix domain-containing protein [Velocimicrobium porci]MSS62336.1 AraC family transcriptional regulator [Velocimicrobium porci]
MAHVQYSITNIYNQSPIERLLYISSASYGKDWISMLHSHSFTELFYVIDGNGYFCTENEEISIQKDSLIIINPNVKHTEKSSTEKALTYIVLGIDNLRFEFKNPTSTSFQSYNFEEYRNEILPILQTMLSEVKQKKKNYEQICQHYFMVFLLKMLRITEEEFSFSSSKDVPTECEAIKEYIDTHYQETITLDTLTNVSHLNKFYLTHIFSKAYGISPINYLLERRILHSKELLKNSDFSITQIAHVTGFSSSNYFSQSFKKYTGTTPKGYRQKYNIKRK